MLTGRRAFGGDDISTTLANVLKDDVSWQALPGDLPRRCVACCGAASKRIPGAG